VITLHLIGWQNKWVEPRTGENKQQTLIGSSHKQLTLQVGLDVGMGAADWTEREGGVMCLL